ncbi:hypothetical protein ACFLV0_06610 [Chloroflexota bacterium]
MGLFSKRLSGSYKEEAIALVRHLQTMLAYQQLAMETYNDAAASIAGEASYLTSIIIFLTDSSSAVGVSFEVVSFLALSGSFPLTIILSF